MIHAYDKLYLQKTRVQLATMFDYAINNLNIELNDFYNAFLISKVSKKIECGDSSTIVGKSGIELVKEIYGDFNNLNKTTISRSREYWLGYYLSYYQWYTCFSFSEINKVVPIDEMIKMYSKYHEASEEYFVEALNQRMKNKDTNLKIKRINVGLSQSELAKQANIPLRTIQQYEQRQKDINSAKTSTLLALSKALYCDVLDLYEKI